MKRRKGLSLTACVMLTAQAAGLLANAAQQTKEERQAKLAAQAKITREQAEATALKRRPGKVEEAELEREHGRLVYSFDIRNARGTIDEVQVSAITGKVVRIEDESQKHEAAEKKKARQKPD